MVLQICLWPMQPMRPMPVAQHPQSCPAVSLMQPETVAWARLWLMRAMRLQLSHATWAKQLGGYLAWGRPWQGSGQGMEKGA